MDYIDKVSKFFGEKSSQKEILYLALGLLFILILNQILRFDISSVPNYEQINSTQKFIFLIVVAYFLAKICYDLGEFLTNSILFVFRDNCRQPTKKFFKELSEYLNSNVHVVSEENLRDEFVLVAVESFKDSTYLRASFDEADTNSLISTSFFGISVMILAFSAFIPNKIDTLYLLIITMILLLNSCARLYLKNKAAVELVEIFLKEGRKSIKK